MDVRVEVVDMWGEDDGGVGHSVVSLCIGEKAKVREKASGGNLRQKMMKEFISDSRDKDDDTVQMMKTVWEAFESGEGVLNDMPLEECIDYLMKCYQKARKSRESLYAQWKRVSKMLGDCIGGIFSSRCCSRTKFWNSMKNFGKLKELVQACVNRMKSVARDKKRKSVEQLCMDLIFDGSAVAISKIKSFCSVRGGVFDSKRLAEEDKRKHIEFWNGLWNRNLISIHDNEVMRWLEPYCSKLRSFAKVENGEEIAPWYTGSNTIDIAYDINDEEIVKALKRMKWRKAPGPSGIPVDLFKVCMQSSIIMCKLKSECQRVIMGSPIPEGWRKSRLVLLYKTKPPSDEVGFQRPINLLESAFRIMDTVMYNRMHVMVENYLEDIQGGFRNRRGCVEQVFIVSIAVQRAKAQKRNLVLVSMDLKKAYDSVSHNALLYACGKMGMNRRSVLLLRRLLSDHKIEDMSKEIEVAVSCGVMQGGITSPDLFNLYIDRSLCGFEDGSSILLPVRLCQVLYADDRCIISDSVVGAERLVEEACTWAKNNGAEYNSSKTVWTSINEEVDEILVNGERITRSSAITILGMNISPNDYEVVTRKKSVDIIAKESAKLVIQFWNKIKSLSNFRMARLLVCYFFFPRVLYGSELVGEWKDAIVVDRSLFKILRFMIGCPLVVNASRLMEFSGVLRVSTRQIWLKLRFLVRLLAPGDSLKMLMQKNLLIVFEEQLPWYLDLLVSVEKLRLNRWWMELKAAWVRSNYCISKDVVDKAISDLRVKIVEYEKAWYYKKLLGRIPLALFRDPSISPTASGVEGYRHLFWVKFCINCQYRRHEEMTHMDHFCEFCDEEMA